MRTGYKFKKIYGGLFLFIIFCMLFSGTSCWSDLDELNEMSKGGTYKLRDRGPAGGWIFHIVYNGNGTYTYYEAAPVDAETLAKSWLSANEWLNGESVAEGETLTAIGTGRHNTEKILQYRGLRTALAAQDCAGLNLNGYNDWFLPSIDELYQMSWVLHSRGGYYTDPDDWESVWVEEDNPMYGEDRVGGFSDQPYKSSSEYDETKAWIVFFIDGGPYPVLKTANDRVRPVRTFVR